jgi:LuxR family maltose regulon positive regulatory protein
MEGQIFYNNNLLIPDSQQYLERKGIKDILERALQGPIITVVAGEGYGKTFSISSLLQKYNGVTVWLQLSERDNLGWRLWENFTGAVAHLSRELAAELAELGFPETARQFDRYLAVIENKFKISKKHIVVLDDFHLIREPRIFRFLERIVAALRQDSCLILISRTEPALNTVPLLSKGLLSRITVEDLRFSKEEIDDYFKLQNISLTQDDLTLIHHDTEGWPLALNLIVREIKGQSRGEKNYVSSLKKINSIKIMEEELFAALPEDLKKFLIKLSLIEQWHLELLEKLSSGRKLIEELNRISFFIRYDAYFHGYRIHHLFVDFLQKKQNLLSPEEIRDVYTQAAEWCRNNNLRMDAAVYYERAGDCRGLTTIIDSFFRILPRAMAAFFLEITDRLIPRGDEQDEDFLYLRWVTRAKLLMTMGRFEESTAENRKAIGQFEVLPPSPLHFRILSACYGALGTISILTCRLTKDYTFAPNFEWADYYFSRYPEPSQRNVTQAGVCSYVNQIGYPAERGEFERALDAFTPAIPYAVHCFNGYLYGQDTLGRAEIAYFRGDLINAETFARQAVFQGREKKQYEVENRGLFFLLRVSLHRGELPIIQETFRQLEAMLAKTDFLNRRVSFDIINGWFYTHIGYTEQLPLWLRNDFEESELNTIIYALETLVKAKYSFAEKRYDAVLNTLEHSVHKFSLESYVLGRLEMTLLKAVTHFHRGELKTAIQALETSWEIACSNSLDMPFIELGEDMRLLAGVALKEGTVIPRPWLETIRSRASAYGKKLLMASALYSKQDKIEEKTAIYLSKREQKILNGLSQGLTREEIAAGIGISLNTVKGLIKNIYNRLGAINRADAIRIAGDIGILKKNI